ncbi:MAG: flagellar biosynthetic protein FliO [Gammaproteobacteria bacterium RIFCSPLOWO2_02_FULL_56_15]|nr:MAG: flagellar biosynthetic protein FliO [Gammaproteobacteria bacterium RIFCSPLOWO2_02_FULL_56_15]
MLIRHSTLLALALPLCAWAETPQATYAPPASAVTAASMLQMLGGLLLVLAVVGAAFWLLRRFAVTTGTAAGAIKVIAGAAVGQRERVVLVEIGTTWLVLGVAPGQVSALHSMPKVSATHLANDLPAPPRKGFQVWLRQVMEKRNAS